MSGLTYDTGALIAAERADRRLWALHRRALERRLIPDVPAAVLVEAWRGAPELTRLLQGCLVEPLDDGRARAAGLLHGRCPLAVGAVDATVVENALRRAAAVVTSNRTHIQALADAAGRRIAVIDI